MGKKNFKKTDIEGIPFLTNRIGLLAVVSYRGVFLLLKKTYRPYPENVLLRAFEVLDTDNKGYLTQEGLTKFMTEEGEPFTQEEMDEMLSASLDPDQNVILYKEFVSMMTVEDD
ncbi:dynein regulatory complex protein 8 [Callorhinchus milii]|uniref:dynein regulatory complex protein 8 n=1 Tax=Callorhinchus milii TaxID=7868 RepID=UPI001C3FB29C|nr:dynein regulatory complex protein 8 [Callorhinchus milii]